MYALEEPTSQGLLDRLEELLAETVQPRSKSNHMLQLCLELCNATGVVTCAHYACVADCADAMADAWEDTAGCALAICLHENLLKCQYIVKWGLHGIVHI